ncbi:MAG: sigma-70 family RNA polymerase sigma factor [Verrucomicrobiales bacterium]|nr:sigma-70 family RNA polymerase sigma factor [Verrucomicrobiales bacterium]
MRDSSPVSAEEFAALYAAHHLDLLRYVMSLVPNRTEAQDIVQDAARSLWQKADQYDPSRPFGPWARRFAHFEVLKHRKKQSIKRKYFADELIEELAVDRVELEPELGPKREALAFCLNKLDGPSRELIVERFGKERSLKDIAASQNRTPNALYLVMHRLRQKLFECVSRRLRESPS